MKMRRTTRYLAAGAGVISCAGLLATAGLAGTAGADAGVTLTAPSPNAPSGATVKPGTPFSSGQTINVSVSGAAVAAAGISTGSKVQVLECGAPGGVDPTTPVGDCDSNTINAGTIFASQSTGVTVDGYSIFALPDAYTFLEDSSSVPVCDLTHECVLYIGTDQEVASAPHIYSAGFFVNPGDGTDDGANPGDGLPEVPLAVGLPLAAAGIFGGVFYRRRRRAGHAA